MYTQAGRMVITGFIGLLLVACGGTPTAPQGAGTGTGSAEATISVREPWVRAAVVTTDTSMQDHMSSTETMTETDMDHTMGDMQEDMPDMASSGGSNSAAYMVVVNNGTTDDAIVGATTSADVAEVVELHTVLNENGIMQMRPVPRIDIPANGQTELKPGSFHIMLLGIKHDLSEGDTVNLTLQLQSGGEIEVAAPVRKLPQQ